MKKRSIVGIILTVIGVILIIVALWPGLVVPKVAPGFGPIQVRVLIAGIVAAVAGGIFCLRTRTCCGAQPAAEQKKEPPPAT